MAKITIKSLQAEMAAVRATSNENYEKGNKWHERAAAAETREKETRQQFDDLKRRLHDSEMEVARLNGYLARVKEDDIVREDLVTTGDPEGGQRLVPKRKHEYLGNREAEYTDFRKGDRPYFRDDNPKPKHWIEY